MKFVCSICGYVYEGEAAPEKCPVCGVGADKFKEQTGEREWAAEHVVGVAKGVSEDILADLRANFEGECSEVGMYLAMARVAHRDILKLDYTMKKLHGKKLSTLLNSQNFLAKLLQTAQRRTLRCV